MAVVIVWVDTAVEGEVGAGAEVGEGSGTADGDLGRAIDLPL